MIFNNVSDFMMVSFATEKATGSAIFDLPFWIIEIIPFQLKLVFWTENRKAKTSTKFKILREKKNNDENLTQRLPFDNMKLFFFSQTSH